MIELKTGSLKLDDYSLIIHPELTELEFSKSSIPIECAFPPNETGWVKYNFTAGIDKMKADFLIYFRFGSLRFLDWQPSSGPGTEDWCDVSVTTQKQILRDWLNRVIGDPNFEYDWGVLGMERDMKTGDFSLILVYKRELLARQEAR